jgi:hypothetical protein
MLNRSERRGGPRFEIFAQASVISGGDSYLMSVRNVSAAGAFLEGNTREHPDLTPGVAIELVLSPTGADIGDDEVINIRCRAIVTRIEAGTLRQPGGFGVSIEPAAASDREQLESLLRRLGTQQALSAASAG